mmetsp:Transcript_33791/g.90515  ORF Transcript_33791/g.90515 Transcript_33791/m.90515 type:complete len:239 (+) Transcript_33791:830-1546(+)
MACSWHFSSLAAARSSDWGTTMLQYIWASESMPHWSSLLRSRLDKVSPDSIAVWRRPDFSPSIACRVFSRFGIPPMPPTNLLNSTSWMVPPPSLSIFAIMSVMSDSPAGNPRYLFMAPMSALVSCPFAPELSNILKNCLISSSSFFASLLSVFIFSEAWCPFFIAALTSSTSRFRWWSFDSSHGATFSSSSSCFCGGSVLAVAPMKRQRSYCCDPGKHIGLLGKRGRLAWPPIGCRAA